MIEVNVRLRIMALTAACSVGGCSIDSRNVGSLGGSGGGAGARADDAGQGGGAVGSPGSGGAGAGGAGAGPGGAGGSDASMSGGSAGASTSMGGSSDPSDAGMGGAAGGGTWCSTQSPSVGVVAADFQCLDFESVVPAEVWVSEVTGTAALATTLERAFSPATSLRSNVPEAELIADRTVATLEWANVGAESVLGVRVAMQVNPVALNDLAPPWTGSVVLACIAFGSGNACLHYTRSDTFTGLFLPWTFTGGPANADECPVSGSLQPELWNAVELIVGSDDGIRVLIDGVEATSDCVGIFGVATVASVTVGLQSRQLTSQGWTVYFDDIVAETLR